MSREIDERVVQMQFDNAQFESGAQTTMGTLDKLKSKLGFEGATKGIEEIQNASKSFDLSPISNAVDTVQLRFGAMEVFVFNALSRISNYAISTGINLVKSLSVNQIAAGWSKYEMKTNSVQTIMNAGYDLDKVNKSLEKLNWFTDETSYSYVDMVNNISKFTSSNVDLDTAITSMIGIADAAGLAGASVQDASHAMEGFSKAIAQGYMSRQNWQWIRTAHLDTTMFKQTLIDAAVEQGTLKKLTDGTYKVTTATGKSTKDLTVSIEDFETAMHHGWVTTNVMNTALGKFGGATEKIYAEYQKTGELTSDIIERMGGNLDELGLKAFKSAQVAKTFTDAIQSVKDAVSTGWMTTFEIIFGDFNEATELWTDLANEMWDVFAAGGAERNEMLAKWKELGGRDSFINAFWNTWNGVLNIINLVKESFRNIFPKIEAEKLLEYTKKFEAFTDKFKRFFQKDLEGDARHRKGLIPEEIASDIDAATERVENLSRTFKGVFAIFDILKQIGGAIAQIAGIFIKALIPSFDSILGTTGDIGEWFVNLNDHLKETGFFGKLVEKVTPAIETFGKITKKAIEWVTAGLSFLIELLGKLRDHFKPVGDNISSFTEWIGPKFAALGKVLDFFKGILNGIKILYDDVKPLLGRVWKSFTDALGAFWGALREGIGNLTAKDGIDIFSATELSLAFKHLIDIFLQFKNSNIFSQVMRYFRDGLWDIEDVWERVRWNLRDLELDMKAWAADKTAGAILKVAGAIAIMAGSLILLSGVDSNKLATALLAISALSGIVVGLGKALAWVVGSGSTKIDSFKALFGALSDSFSRAYQWQAMSKSLLYVAGAVAILAIIAAVLGQIDPAKLTAGVIAVGFLCLELSFMAAVLSTVGKEKGAGTGSIAIAFSLLEFVIALGILVAEVKTLGTMNTDQLVQGLLATLALVFMLTAAAKVLQTQNTAFVTNKGMGARVGFALIELAASLVLIVKAVKNLGALDTEHLSRGMSGVTLLLVELVAASYVLGKVPATRMLASAVSLIAMAGALHILVSAVKKMGGLTDEEVGRGLGGLAAGLIELCVAALFLQDAIPAAGALLMMGGALVLIATAMQMMASLGYENLIGLIFAMAGIFTVIGVAASILAPISAGLMTFAGSLALVGLAIALVGVGISGIAIGLLILVKVLSNGVTTIINGLRELIVGLLLILRDTIPLLVEVVIEALVAIVVAIGDNADLILMAVVNVIVALVKAVWALLVELWNAVLAPLFPQLIGFLSKVGDFIYDYVIKPFIYALEVAIGFIASLIWGALEIMFGWLGFFFPEVTTMFEDGWKKINNLFTYEDSKSKGKEIEDGWIAGLEEGQDIDDLKNIMRNKTKAAEDVHKEDLKDWENMSIEDMEAYIKGGNDMKGPLYDSGYELPQEVYNGANAYDLYGNMYDIGVYGTTGLLKGAESKLGELYTSGGGIAKTLAGSVQKHLDESSPSKLMAKIGSYATQGLINGVVSLKDKLANESAGVAESSVNSVRNGFAKLSSIVDGEIDSDPTIKPVLDLSEIQNGVNTMDGMFGSKTMAISGMVGNVRTSGELAGERFDMSLNRQFRSFEDRLSAIENDRTYQFNLTTEIDGRQVARSTARYTREELEAMDKRANRKVGIV